MLFSFILLSCIVVSNREITNINISFYNLAISNSIGVNTIFEEINIDELRDKFLSSSPNTSRGILSYLDFSFILYMNTIEVQSNDLFWFNQTE